MKILMLLLLVGCGVSTSGNININTQDIKIVKKNNLCFAVVASRKTLNFNTSGLGMAYVPCEKVGP